MANTVYSASLIMTADVKQAKAQLKDLQQSLNSLMKTSHDSSPLGLTQEIAKATSDVAGLKAALQSATNTNTGKLDLSKFSKGLDAAKLDIKQVASSLQSLGPAGQQAFSQLATSIMSAEVPLKRTNQLLDDFKTTLANTVKWQISSSMVNSLVGAMQHAYGYAQDLNKSLNDIRIVTGYSTDQMSKFAKEANNAAKALSTTTTQYTDAALIYYQQGLAEKDIKARTDATIKMANVTGESARAVSDYMTAIWNNFDNGSKSIEYYADVMTALGAATASSTDEIAAGLEKFAAVSETVGLSYEYATAALATVTAETRQSADVVGNSFKTLFSRIQGLNLGETMDDGTTLNKYSQALAKVGIDIKDTTGEIKAMDTILDELGTKWDTLSNDTQMALAQTVAGVRQYNQLISLMNNWDTFKINLGVAVDAEGTLQEQADIYAESWQAAADRVEAAFQDIYDSILNDEFFIKLTDFFGGLIDVIGNTVDGIGGMSGAFAALGIVTTRVFGKDIAKGINNLFDTPEKKQKKAKDVRQDALDSLRNTIDDGSPEGSIISQGYATQADWQQKIIDKAEAMKAKGHELNEIEKIRLGYLTDQLKLMTEQESAMAKETARSRNQVYSTAFQNDTWLRTNYANQTVRTPDGSSYQPVLGAFNDLRNMGEQSGRLTGLRNMVTNAMSEAYASNWDKDSLEQFQKKISDFKNSAKKRLNEDSDEYKELMSNLEGIEKITDQTGGAEWLNSLEEKISDLNEKTENLRKNIREALVEAGADEGQVDSRTGAEVEGSKNLGENRVRGVDVGIDTDNRQKDNERILGEIDTSKLPDASEGFMALGDAISSTALAFTSFKGLWDTWNNQDATFGEKLVTTFTTLCFVIPMVTNAFNKTSLAAMNMAVSTIAAKLGMTTFAGSAQAAAASLLEVEGAAKLTQAAMLGPLLKVVAVIALVAAAIAGIAIAIDNASYTAEEKLENAKQSAEEFKTSLEEAKNAAQELNSAFDNYNSIVDKLNSCTEGTREYRNALIEANNAALDLLQTYPELYNIDGAVEKLDNGLISITEKGQNYLTDQAVFRQNALNYANARNNFEIGQLENEQTNRQMNINERHLSRAEVLNDNYSQEKDIYYKTEEERVTDSLYQQVKAVADDIYKNSSPEKFKDDFVDALEEKGIEGLEMIDIDGITNSMIDLYQAETELATSIDNNTMQMKLQNENAVDAALGEDAQYKTDIEKSLLGGALQQETDKIRDSIYNADSKIGTLYDTDRTDKLDTDLLKRYNAAKGGKYTLDENSLTGGKDSRFVHLLDEAGNQIKVSAETFADTIASYEAMAKLSNGKLDVESTMKALNGLNTEENKNISSAVQDFIVNGDFSSLTADEAKQINPDEIFGQLKDNPVFEQIWMAAGFESGEAFIEGMKTDLSNMNFDDIFNNLKMSFDSSSVFTPSDFEGMSYGIQKSVASALDEAYTQVGQDGAEKLIEILAVAAGEGEEVLEQVLNLVKNFDWSSGTEEEFANQLYTIMGNASAAGDAINHFGNEMEAAGKKIPLDSLDEFIAKIHELIVLLNDLKIGDIVSEDVVNQLAAQGIAIQDYAIKTYEGWKLISQIPTNDLQEKSSNALQTAQDAYNFIEDKTFSNDGGATYDDIYTAAQRNLGFGGAAVRDNINTFTEGMDPEVRAALFSKVGDADEISRILDGDAIGTIEQYDSMLQAIMNLFTQGKAGSFTDEAINSAKLYEKASVNGLTSMTKMDEFRNADETISQAGAEALQGFAADDEIYSDALNDYQEALKEAGEDTEAINKATEDFYKRLKKIENTKAAKSISDLQDNMKDMVKGSEEYESAIGEMQTQLEKTFGKKTTKKWIENNKALLEQWSNGATELERGRAQQAIDFSLADASDISEEEQAAVSSLEVPIEFALNEEGIPDISGLMTDLGLNQTQVINCIATGDFTSLLGQMKVTEDNAGALMSMLATIGATNLTPEGFQELINALADFQTAIAAVTESPGSPEAQKAIDQAKTTLGAAITAAFQGDAPNVAPDTTKLNGGGGGGSKSSSRSDLMKKLQDAELDTYDKKIERSEKMREGMSPDKASKYIKEEIELLEEEQKILEKQIKSWKKLLKEKVQEFNAEHPEFEIELTDDGMIANLSELYARLQVELENADTEEEVRMIEDIVNDLDDASDYQQRIDDNVAAIADKERQQAEKALEEITERIDWRIKQIDYQIERLNYYQEKLLIQAHGNKQTIEAMLEGFQYQEQEMLQLFEKGAALRQGIDELNAAKAQYPGYSQMFDEQILEYQSDLIDVNMDILNLRKEMEELVQNVLELALEEIDTQTGRIDKYVSMLDHFNNIIDLSGRTMLDQSLKVKIGTMKVETMVNKMQILKQQMEGLATATKEAQDALARRAADGDETSVKFWENQVEELKHELETATDEFLGSWEETLNTAVELFEMRVELAVNTLSDALSPFSTLELFQQNYEQEKHIQDQYLDDAKKLYELNKLNRELNKAITDENDLLAKSKLREIQQQIYDLQKAGVEMSQFDLDILQKKYDLRLAEIALLESQNSKTSMRLVRDAAGNWTYVYDADEEKIEDATQKYEDALYELDQLAKEYINDVSEQLIENQIEYKDALMDLDKNAADYQEQLIGLQEYYTERQRYLLSELNKSVEESGILFHETLYGQMTDIYNYEDAYNQFIKNSNLTITELMTNYKDWQGIVEQAMNVAGTSWENFGVDTEGTLGSLESYIQQLCDEISKLVDVLMSYVSEAIGMVEEWQSKYSKQTDSELAKNEQYINGSFGGGNGKKQEVDMRTDWERVIRELAAGKTGVTDAYGNEVTDIKYAAEMRELKRHAAIGGTRIQYERSGEDFTDEHQKAAVDKLTAEMLRDIANEMVSGDTGLYTGSWPTSEGMDGKGGKLAILHSKELLLNQKDTENILKAVEYTRSKEIGSSIDNKIQNMLLSAGEQFKSLVEQVQLSSYSSLQLPIEQIVHINADFPSVTNSNEIEEAFANLTNDASQYLNIKKF